MLLLREAFIDLLSQNLSPLPPAPSSLCSITCFIFCVALITLWSCLLIFLFLPLRYKPCEKKKEQGPCLTHPGSDCSMMPSMCYVLNKFWLNVSPEPWPSSLLRVCWILTFARLLTSHSLFTSFLQLPYFMNELTLTELDMGVAVPKILQAFKPYVDHQGNS